MNKKIFVFALTFLLLGLCAVVPSFAAGKTYYMVDGRIYSTGSAELRRIDVVENAPTVTIRQGDANSYVLASADSEGEIIDMYTLDLNFELSADAGGGTSDYAVFTAFVPYSDDVYAFFIIDSNGDLIAQAYTFEAVQTEILYFNVEKNESGYNLNWEVGLSDADSADMLEYDVMTVSSVSGETNLLAYRLSENNLYVPSEWLDPNDTVVFTLKSNDGRTTLTAVSNEFETPQGEAKTIADKDVEWSDTDGNGETGSMTFIIVAAIAAVSVIVAVVVVAVIVKKKRRKV